MVDAALRMGALAVLVIPVRSAGILSTLAMAKHAHAEWREWREWRKRAARLAQKRVSANPISKAKAILVRTRSVSDSAHAPWLPGTEADSYIAGMIWRAAAAGTAMALAWRRLTGGTCAVHAVAGGTEWSVRRWVRCGAGHRGGCVGRAAGGCGGCSGSSIKQRLV